MKELEIKEVNTQRNFGIDLLRLISMFMVVVLHVLGNGGVLRNTQPLSIKSEVLWFLELSCYCAVNVFAIISGVVGLRAKHKFSSLINLCLQLIFYSVIITSIYIAISVYNGIDISLKNIIFALIPSIRSLWYFSAYFCLFFFMPILNLIIENTPRKALRTGAIFIFIVFCCFGQVESNVANLKSGYSVLWLAILYLFGAYMTKYDLFNKLSLSKGVLVYLICILLTSLSRIIFGNTGIRIDLLISYTSPTILLSAIFLVASFKKINFSNKFKKIISLLYPMAFGVYLIHCHPIIYNNLLTQFSWIALKSVYFAPFIVVGIALIIYFSCLFIDWLRLLLFKVCKMKEFSIWIEKLFGKIISRILKFLHIKIENE